MASDRGFAPGVAAWRRGLGRARDEVRQELVARQLAAHLKPASARGEQTALDIGCGQGTQAIRLARAGYQVTGVDLSEELLADARAGATGATAGAACQTRLRFERRDLLDLGDDYQERFDVVCCHGVLMYLPSLTDGIAAVVGAARPAGLISVLTRNRASIAMRAGMTLDWAGAVEGFDARYYGNRLGLTEVRADEPDEVAQALHQVGARRIAWYGVRLFTDHWDDVETAPESRELMLAAEEEAGRRDPYRCLAALTHTLAIRHPG